MDGSLLLLLFLALALGVIITIGSIHGAEAFTMLPTLDVTGSLLVLVSYIILPWVYFNPLPNIASVSDFKQEMADSSILQQLGVWEDTIIAELPFGVDEATPVIEEQQQVENLAAWKELVATNNSLTGLAIMRSVPYKSFSFRILLWMTLILPILSLLSLVLQHLGRANEAKLLNISSGASATILVVILLSELPAIDTFGVREGLHQTLLFLEAGTNTAAGVWGVLNGVILIQVGSLVRLSSSSEHGNDDDIHYL